jgi:hypothetical protein
MTRFLVLLAIFFAGGLSLWVGFSNAVNDAEDASLGENGPADAQLGAPA